MGAVKASIQICMGMYGQSGDGTLFDSGSVWIEHTVQHSSLQSLYNNITPYSVSRYSVLLTGFLESSHITIDGRHRLRPNPEPSVCNGTWERSVCWLHGVGRVLKRQKSWLKNLAISSQFSPSSPMRSTASIFC